MEWILFLFVFVIIYGIVWALQNVEKKRKLEQAKNNDFLQLFIGKLKKEGLQCSNVVTVGTIFGMAVFDNKEGIAIISAQNKVRTISKEDILKCELEVHAEQIQKAKTKQPIISWNTVGNTTVQTYNSFRSADLLLFVNDIHSPNLKFTFYDQEQARKYYSLILILINSK